MTALRVLIVEDSADDAELLVRTLQKGGYEPFAQRVENAQEMRASLLDAEWDLIVADNTLPTFSAASALDILQGVGIDLPFIIVSGTIGEDAAVAAMKTGAHDYIMKGNLSRFIPAVQRELREAEVRRARAQAEQYIRHMAYHDALTGLPNRTLFMDRLQQSLLEAERSGNLVAVMYVDLDHFKGINDTLGHDTGDLLLRMVAERLCGCLRAIDTVARVGGDEFTVVLAGISSVADVARTAQKLLDAFGRQFSIDDHDISMSPSIGISMYPADADKLDVLLRNADTAMYRAKQQGRNAYQFFTTDLQTWASQRPSLAMDLARAIERQQLVLHYQQQVDLTSGAIVGVEALLRWDHPEYGLVTPDRFIPLAEETGLIVEIGDWVLHTACAQNKAWQEAHCPPIRMVVNISGRQFHGRQLWMRTARALERSGLAPVYLDLELTESIIMHNIDGVFATLNQLRELGISISIDDFGTGYSSLSYLKRFPIDNVKIDQIFVRNVATDNNDAAIAQAIIAMVHTLGLRVIAEGVETPEQLEFLRRNHCDVVQGYYIHRPTPADAFVWTNTLKNGAP